MRKTIIVIGAILTALPAWGQSSLSYSFGPNLGTLNYQSRAVAYYCTGGTIHYTEYFYSNFVYVPSQGSSQSLGGSTTYTYNPTGYSGCPKSTPGPSLTFNESSYTIVVNPQCCGNINATITVPGYVNPKYVVLGVTYAPPGPQSYVDYTNSTLVSNTSSLNSSFSSSYSVRVSISTMGNLFGFIQAKQTSSSTSSYTQESTNSSTTTVSKAASVSIKVPGPANAYVGDDHDYDIIWVWLNPVTLFTLTNYQQVQWNGYGYSTLDQPAMDVIGVYVGCLNGNISQTYCNSTYQNAFARGWASTETWPSGQGPGLTSADLQNILATDPYGHCTSASAIGSSACPSPDATRFTLTSNQNLQYQQAPPGGQPFTTTYTESYTNTSTQGQGATNTFSQAFGWEGSFTSSIFKNGFTLAIATSQTFTWKNQWNNQFTSSTTSTAEASITGPPCNVVGGNCSPVYPPSSPTYGEGVGFDVYQDNLYGTFLLVPVNY